MEKEQYFYSEGYIYQGEDTICHLYGTEKEMEIGKSIVEFLNSRI